MGKAIVFAILAAAVSAQFWMLSGDQKSTAAATELHLDFERGTQASYPALGTFQLPEDRTFDLVPQPDGQTVRMVPKGSLPEGVLVVSMSGTFGGQMGSTPGDNVEHPLVYLDEQLTHLRLRDQVSLLAVDMSRLASVDVDGRNVLPRMGGSRSCSQLFLACIDGYYQMAWTDFDYRDLTTWLADIGALKGLDSARSLPSWYVLVVDSDRNIRFVANGSRIVDYDQLANVVIDVAGFQVTPGVAKLADPRFFDADNVSYPTVFGRSRIEPTVEERSVRSVGEIAEALADQVTEGGSP